MIEIPTILAPTDFSKHAAKAVRHACELAARFGSELHLLHVLSDMVPAGPDPMLAPVLPPDFYAESEARSLESLRHVLDPSWGKPARVETVVRWGTPVEMILAYAHERSISLMVIATHGRTGLSHALLGSTAEQILREAPCPVLTIRSKD